MPNNNIKPPTAGTDLRPVNLQDVEALIQVRECLRLVQLSHHALQKAQNEIAFVEGHGSSEIYSKLADVYNDQLIPLIEQLKKFKPTGTCKL